MKPASEYPASPPRFARIKAWMGLVVLLFCVDTLWWSVTENHMGFFGKLFGEKKAETVEGSDFNNLSNPSEILNGLIALSLQSPDSVSPRLLLWRALDGMQKAEPDLVASVQSKVDALMNEHSLPNKMQADVVKVLAEVGE